MRNWQETHHGPLDICHRAMIFPSWPMQGQIQTGDLKVVGHAPHCPSAKPAVPGCSDQSFGTGKGSADVFVFTVAPAFLPA